MATNQGSPDTEPKRHPVVGEDPLHEWLLDTSGSHHSLIHHPLDIVTTLRVYVENLPETKATFSHPEALDGTDIDCREVRDEYLHLLGTWRSPQSPTDLDLWVNPEYADKGVHSDVRVECACGATMVRRIDDAHSTTHDWDNDHTEDCTRPDRMRARARLLEKRVKVAELLLTYGHSVNDATQRIGVESIGPTMEAVGKTAQEYKDEFRIKRAHTMAYLRMSHTTATIARAYGVSTSTVRASVARHTPYDISTCAEVNDE